MTQAPVTYKLKDFMAPVQAPAITAKDIGNGELVDDYIRIHNIAVGYNMVGGLSIDALMKMNNDPALAAQYRSTLTPIQFAVCKTVYERSTSTLYTEGLKKGVRLNQQKIYGAFEKIFRAAYSKAKELTAKTPDKLPEALGQLIDKSPEFIALKQLELALITGNYKI